METDKNPATKKPAKRSDEWKDALEQLRETAGGAISGAMYGMYEGVKHDVERWGKAVALDLAKATAAGDKQLTDELWAQAKAIAGVNKIRLVHHRERVVRGVIAGVFDMMTTALSLIA